MNKQFDKLLLAVLFVIVLGIMTHMRLTGNDDSVNWAREQGSLILGALIAIITGAVVGAVKAPAPPEQPSTAPTVEKADITAVGQGNGGVK